jgi:multidrug efflux pump subunit AcrB
MFLSNFSVKKPIATLVLIIGMMCMGLLALSHLRVNQNPDVEIPIIVVSVPYPGASPETNEREIIERLEKQMQAITGVTEVNSYGNEGSTTIVLQFDFKRNLIEASDDVRNAIASVRYKLPIEMREPVLQRVDPSAQPIMNLSLSSDKQSHAEISRLAEDQLADRFRAIDGVANVQVNGSLRRELSVLLHAEKLREYNISVSDVTNALSRQNTNAPVGKVRSELDEKGIRLVGRIERPEDFSQVVVKRNGDTIVRLNQIADVRDGFSEIESISTRSGRPNVGIQVIRSREASTVSIAKKVREMVKEIQKELPAGTKLEVTRDGGDDAQRSLNNVIESLVFGAILTIFVVYAFLNSWRSTLITALSLPTSVMAAFIAVWLCGFTLNFMTLLGLSLAIGVLIDDAIVVRENIVRHMENGSDRRTAALEGTAEIGMAVASTTFSIMAVFIPVAFMPGISGEWFRPFALTVACSVIVSLFISFTLDPMLSAYWGDPPGHHHAPKKGIEKLLARFNTWFDHQADRYSRIIAWALHHRKWMAVIAVGSLVAALGLHTKFGGSAFLPKMDAGQIAIEVRTPASSSIGYARIKMEEAAAHSPAPCRKPRKPIADQIERRPHLCRHRQAQRAQAQRRRSRGRPAPAHRTPGRRRVRRHGRAERQRQAGADRVHRSGHAQADGTDQCLYGQAAPGAGRRRRHAVAAGSEGRAADRARPRPVEHAGHLGRRRRHRAARGLRRHRSRRLGRPDRRDPRRGRAPGAGRPRRHREHRAPADRRDRQQHDGAARPDRQDHHGQGPVGHRAQGWQARDHRVGQRAGPLERRSDRRRHETGQEHGLPAGYGLSLGGAGKDQAELFTQMTIALLSGIGLMYLILVMQFGSFTAPLGVMMSLPLSLIGVVLALLLTMARST